MQRFIVPILFSFAVLLTSSGCFYTDIKVPLDTDTSETRLGPKVGTAATQSVLWLVAWGDGSTRAAAENGEITTINHLDSRFQTYFFGVYTRQETIAYGD